MPQQKQLRSSQMKTVLGSADGFWMWSLESGWDLSHPKTPHSEPVTPRVHLNCYISNIAIDSSQTALVIIDMQNLSLSGALKSDLFPAVYQAQDALLRYAIPGARRAKVQVIWLNWGLTEKDLAFMNTETLRVFDWRANSDAADYGMSTDDAMSLDGYIGCGESPRSTGLCVNLAETHLGDRTKVGAGRVLMKGTWNAALHDPLAFAFSDGQAASRPDVLVHKTRNSGMSDATTTCTDYRKREGIRTLYSPE